MRVLLITDTATPLSQLESACLAGIDAIQLRDKKAPFQDLFAYAKKLRQITWLAGVNLLINERVDLALAIRADGVHLPEESLSPRLVKNLRTSLKVGVSVHSEAAAKQAQIEGADYLLFGPVFETASKPGFSQGLAKLKNLTEQTNLPVYAVGGITSDKIPSLLEAGAFGVAAITAFLQAPDIAFAVRSFQAPFLRAKPHFAGLLLLLPPQNHLIAKPALRGGVDAIQFRHKGPYTNEVFAIAQHLHRLCQEARIPFLINDRSDIALALKAAGVHLGQADLPIECARRLLGKETLIGGTASNVEEALALEAKGADYIGFGHIYATKSKQKEYPPIGLAPLIETKGRLKIPLLAIGGITSSNAAAVMRAGADGLAVLSAITESADPFEETQKIKEVLRGRTVQPANAIA